MKPLHVIIFSILLAFSLTLTGVSTSLPETVLPIEPDEDTRLDEIYDQESRLVMFLYSLQGNGEVDYVTGRNVRENQRSELGNPVYYLEPHPIFYWWNHKMWNDPDQDGVNGNEKLYADNTEFDTSRYKPCLFNGQAC